MGIYSGLEERVNLCFVKHKFNILGQSIFIRKNTKLNVLFMCLGGNKLTMLDKINHHHHHHHNCHRHLM